MEEADTTDIPEQPPLNPPLAHSYLDHLSIMAQLDEFVQDPMNCQAMLRLCEERTDIFLIFLKDPKEVCFLSI
jgi:hypothetical protein